MKNSLNLNLTQRTIITQDLRHSIELLQLSTIELMEKLQSEILEKVLGIEPIAIELEKNRVDMKVGSCILEIKRHRSSILNGEAEKQARASLERFKDVTKVILTDGIFFELHNYEAPYEILTINIEDAIENQETFSIGVVNDDDVELKEINQI